MRARNIKPGFFKNELLAECEPLARILFEGLWAYADREGRFEWRPKRIKVEILPYDNCEVTSLLEQLVDKGFIVSYSVNGNQYGYIPKFLDHQKPHIREAQSTIPAPTKAEPRQDLSNDEPQPRRPDSLNPSSLNPDSKESPPSAGPFFSNPQLKKTEKLCKTLQSHFKKNLWPWVKQCEKGGCRPEHIIYCLEQLWEYKDRTKDPWPYLNHIMQVEHQNANEAEAIAGHRQREKEELDFVGLVKSLKPG